MTPEQIQLVQSTWKQVESKPVEVADLFYRRLFALDPDLRPLFPSDLGEQKKKLAQMLAIAVAGLTRLGDLVPAVTALGQRHVGYGVTPSMYETVGVALLQTLESALAEAWTPATREAWTCTYQTLAEVMQQGAKDVSVRDSKARSAA